jgi:hypothetical protein
LERFLSDVQEAVLALERRNKSVFSNTVQRKLTVGRMQFRVGFVLALMRNGVTKWLYVREVIV